ncbi:hypothetical protein BGZ94_003923, partial [Podila epigama]
MTNPFRHLATFLCFARHLDRPTLVICLRVSRAWHGVLESFLWHDFWLLRDQLPDEYQCLLKRNRRSLGHHELRHWLPYVKQQQQQEQGQSIQGQPEQRARRYPSAALIQKNAHCIRRLFYYGEQDLFLQLLPFCTQLQYLETAYYDKDIKQLLGQNLETLHTLVCKTDTVLVKEPILLNMIWMYLINMRALKVVELESIISSDYESLKFGAVCQKLSRLSLVDSKLLSGPSSETADFTAMQSLVLNQSYIPRLDQLELFQLCPNVASLTWNSRKGALPIQNLLSFLGMSDKSPAAHLTSLDLSTSKILDEDLSQLLEVLPALTRLNAAKTLFGSSATRALIQPLHARQMESVNLLDCPGLTKAHAQAILTHCPSLKGFYAPEVSAVGMLGSPWVCTDLEELDIGIADIDQLPAPSFPRHRAIYTQLSLLTQLQVLRLGDVGFVPLPDRRVPKGTVDGGAASSQSVPLSAVQAPPVQQRTY